MRYLSKSKYAILAAPVIAFFMLSGCIQDANAFTIRAYAAEAVAEMPENAAEADAKMPENAEEADAEMPENAAEENSSAQEDSMEDTAVNTRINEGDETPIEILGYSRYTGPNADHFLKEGDKIAVISPSALPTREQTDATIEGLKQWGYVPVEGQYVCPEVRTLDNCREDLEWALKDPEIKAIFCVRGGYASCEVLDVMDRDLIAAAKKPIIGYSDISALHSGWTVAGVPSIHASMSEAFTGLPEECIEVQKHIMQGELPVYRCRGSKYDQQGSAEGILIGGNLTVMTNVINTAYNCMEIHQPYILLLEDVDSDYLYTHVSLTILKNFGVLDHAAGIILGEWTNFQTESNDYDGRSRDGKFQSVYDMIRRQFLKDVDIPVACAFPAGHGEKNYPLLMGAKARLTVTENDYTLEWTEVESGK